MYKITYHSGEVYKSKLIKESELPLIKEKLNKAKKEGKIDEWYYWTEGTTKESLRTSDEEGQDNG